MGSLGGKLGAGHPDTWVPSPHTDPSLSAVHCPADHSLVVPIVVAVVLIVLILIVIIAYLVGRHRRRGGYQPL